MIGDCATPVKAFLRKDRQMVNAKNQAVDIGAKLTALRGALTQREVARRSSVDVSTISRIERNEHDPSLGTLAKILKVYGLTLEVFFQGPAPAGGGKKKAKLTDAQRLARLETELREMRAIVGRIPGAQDDEG